MCFLPNGRKLTSKTIFHFTSKIYAEIVIDDASNCNEVMTSSLNGYTENHVIS